jgi:uncharacterized membrane protein YdjX (TVP38/TMEM64 family)
MSNIQALPARLRRFGPLIAVVAAMAVAFAMGWHHKLSLENVVETRERFHHVLDQHRLPAVLAYMLIYVAAVALSLPGGLILTVTGGLLFGWLVGGLAAVSAATLGATIIFLIARTAIADADLSTLSWLPGAGRSLETLRKLDALLGRMRAGFRQNALSYLLFLRLVPAFPFWAVNLASAVLGVPLRIYVIATFLGIIPATFAFATAGAGLDSVIMAAKHEYAACVVLRGAEACKLKIHVSSLLTKELILALVLLGVVALIPGILKMWRKTHAAAK